MSAEPFMLTQPCGPDRTDTNEEWFDVVDELDQVTGRAPRSAVHRNQLRHRAVHVFLFRSDGKMLIHLRTEAKEEFPSVWTSSASGHVTAGETYDESAQRELHEELGVTTSLTAIQKFPACADTSFEFTMLYVGQSDQPLTPDPAEIADHQWLDLTEIRRWLIHSPAEFSPAFQLLMTWYFSHRFPSSGEFEPVPRPARIEV